MEGGAQGLNLQEFTSQHGDLTLYYQLVSLTGSVYIWVGTDQGNFGSLIAAMESRVGPPALSTLLGPAGDQTHSTSQLAERLQRRTKKHLLLSVNVPSDDLLPQVEQRLIEELCVVS
ncbi:hypothetical protein Pcinc_023879 [Petrolisthes cinctipes]|uniref:Proteasome assembly chaperone 4 n=1 Tax=Petrolisthes cinctipes TaxID=88211 RepID=A0AAE1FAZ3_PETCI|nr:hypothetical protein Pcinc_023879 [Petrolisthes cinctipes]